MSGPVPFVTPLKRIPAPGGAVMHAIKGTEKSFAGFGEAYFSTVDTGAVKGWKRHNRMTLNLVVPVGLVEFVIHDDSGAAEEPFRSFVIGAPGDYARLTVPPGLWMAFCGRADGLNLVLNVASIEHDPDEVDRAELAVFPWTFV